MKEEPVWGNEVVNENLTAALDTCFPLSLETVAILEFPALSQQSREIPLMPADLPKQHVSSRALQGLQLMTNDYIKGKAGFYMTLKSFWKCERMISTIKLLAPVHLLDHLIIPIHVRESHWFPVHMDVYPDVWVFWTRVSPTVLPTRAEGRVQARAHGRKCLCGNSTEWHG